MKQFNIGDTILIDTEFGGDEKIYTVKKPFTELDVPHDHIAEFISMSTRENQGGEKSYKKVRKITPEFASEYLTEQTIIRLFEGRIYTDEPVTADEIAELEEKERERINKLQEMYGHTRFK